MKRMILLVVCLALLCALSGCDMLREQLLSVLPQEEQPQTVITPAADTEPEITVTEPEVTASTEPVSENFEPTGVQMPDTENAVVLLYDVAGTVNGDEEYSYRVPQLNCQTPDAVRINADIAEAYEPLVLEMLDLAAQGLSAYCYRIDYETVWCGDILALIVYCEYPGSCIYYSVYNFDRVTGCEVTNAELLTFAGLDEETFVTLAKARSMEVFDQKYEGLPEDMKHGDFADKQREASASDDFIHPNMRMYLGEDGKLMLISAIGSLAGAEYYEEIYPLIP